MIIHQYVYGDRILDEAIEDVIGPGYSWRQRFKLGRVGSRRMIVKNASEQLTLSLADVEELTFVNVEIRPGGMLVLISKGNRKVAWPIPYHLVSIFKTDVWTIHAEGLYVKLHDRKWKSAPFFRAIMERKNVPGEDPW